MKLQQKIAITLSALFGLTAAAAQASAATKSIDTSANITPSTGCGAIAPQSGTYYLNVDGTQRRYIVSLPANYDNQRAYPLVFGFHPWGGNAEQTVGGGYWGALQAANNGAIFIAGQGLPSGGNRFPPGQGPDGWQNVDGRDFVYMERIFNWANSNLCYDTGRVFAMGHSYGGMFSNWLGCEMGSRIRAIAPFSGSFAEVEVNPNTDCSFEKVAGYFMHGTNDFVVPYANGEEARNYLLQANSCSNNYSDAPSPGWGVTCRSYNSCANGYPVVWCSHSQSHGVPSGSGAAAWNFFNSL